MASVEDIQVASLAAGFTLGFGFLTTWEAIKQTRRNKKPLRSIYICMVWGEITANLCIGVLGWLFLQGVIGDSYDDFSPATLEHQLTTPQRTDFVLLPLLLGLRDPIPHADYHQSDFHHRRESRNYSETEMDHGGCDNQHQHRRVFNLDSGSLESSGERDVSHRHSDLGRLSHGLNVIIC